MLTTPIEEILKSEAELGNFQTPAVIGKIKAAELRKKGFLVEDLRKVNYFPRAHRISWHYAVVPGDALLLDEKSSEFSFAQQLWIITMKAQNQT